MTLTFASWPFGIYVKTGLLLSMLVLGACGRPGLQDKGMMLASPIGVAQRPAPEGPSKDLGDRRPSSQSVRQEHDEDEALPPEAEQHEASQVQTPAANVDPSIPDDQAEPLQSDEEVPLLALWDGKDDRADEWTSYTAKAIDLYGQELLVTEPADVTFYCPRWSKLGIAERKAFYIALISGIAWEESRFNTYNVYTEVFRDSKGKNVKSRGLLQISKESGNYYGCGFVNDEDLHNPQKNLSCGVKILNRWVSKDQRIAGHNGKTWRGGSRYWAVLRGKKDLQLIQASLKSLPFCIIPPNPPPRKPTPPAAKVAKPSKPVR